MKLEPGSTVRFLNSTGGGRVVRIQDNIAYVEDQDGFEVPVLTRECVVVAAPQQKEEKKESRKESKAPNVFKDLKDPNDPKDLNAPKPTPPAPEEKIEETLPGGDTLNLTVAFEPSDIKALSTASYDAYAVNDSNYYLYLTWATRRADKAVWTARYAGIVEPHTQVLLAELTQEDLPDIERMATQYIAFKRDNAYTLQPAGNHETRVDNTKFYRLHCLRPSVYFDTPVLAFQIAPATTEGLTAEQADKLRSSALRPADKPAKEPARQSKPNQRPGFVEVDLHIDALVDNKNGLSNADMLNRQIDRFTEVMLKYLPFPGTKIVFIHGKGEGVLRQALMKELTHRFRGHDVCDASFQEYGYGATQVTIRSQQNHNRPRK